MDSTQKEEGSSTEAETKKCCSVCKTTKTPLWRSGPSGPKSLCNACGIRYRKKRPTTSTTTSPVKNLHMKKGKMGKRRSMKLSDEFRVNLMMMPLEEQVEEEEQRIPKQWGEVERAALLLMALSCGAVFA